ncbi:MAG TPA: tetratricopeptide repeat protein [Gemmatimonadales bacterium]|nr:tetratricopeptide repeat protein [Gemmatimonadales bacterium]
MTRGLTGGVVLAFVLAGSLAAQQDGVANRVVGALDTRLIQPDCKLDGGGDFRVSSGKTYLKTGIEGTGDPINRINALKNGARVITEAITTAGQTKNPAAWYYLGRIYLQQGDVVGADSAFNRAQALAPACKDDIKKYRYRGWAALVNAGQTFRQAKQNDSAMVMFRAANVLDQTLPLSYVFMADLFNELGQNDSAIVYFGKGAASDTKDANMVKARDQAAFNYGVLLLNSNRAKDAVPALQRYRSLQPDDVAGKKALAQAFRAAGMVDSAKVLESELISSAGGAPSGGAAAAGGEVSEDDLMDFAVKQFNDKNYKDAAATFAKVLAANPWNRDALFNQANAYLALSDGAGTATAAEKLIEIEPLSEYDHSLRIQGYKLAKNQDGIYKAVVAHEALPVNVEVQSFKLTSGGATFDAKVTGREARDENNKIIPAKPLTLVIDFLGADGSVVGSAETPVPVLKAGESRNLSVPGTGAGIRAWRYKVK